MVKLWVIFVVGVGDIWGYYCVVIKKECRFLCVDLEIVLIY